MPLPAIIQTRLLHILKDMDERVLQVAAEDLTDRYRDRQTPVSPGFRSVTECCAYIAMRMPATYEACASVFGEMASRSLPFTVRSMLDVGSGPGTSLIAAVSAFAELESVVLMEPSKMMADVGCEILDTGWTVNSPVIEWKSGGLSEVDGRQKFDLVTASYVLGELRGGAVSAVERLWSATDQCLILIEPGSKAGFARLRAARQHIIEVGGHIAAPCTHCAECPMAPDDWCHFSVPVQRTSLHRRIKGASRGDEREKFSYLVACRTTVPYAAPARIVKRPIKAKGHVHLDLCSADGLQRRTISKRDTKTYKTARKSGWGDLWPYDI